MDGIFAPIETGRLRLEPITTQLAHAILAGDLSGLTAGRGWPHRDTADGLRMALLRGHPPGWLILLRTAGEPAAGEPGVVGDIGSAGSASDVWSTGDVWSIGDVGVTGHGEDGMDGKDGNDGGIDRDIVIGDCGTHGPADNEGAIEIGYGLAARYRGQGFGTELVAALTRWLLAQPGIRRVRARTHVGNLASRRVLEKAGFRQVSLTGAEIVLVAGG